MMVLLKCRSLKLSIFLAFHGFYPLVVCGETGGRSLCYQHVQQAVNAEKPSLMATKQMLETQLSSARSKLSLPKVPQLRTRFENTIDVENPKGRIGLRWYLPRFTSGSELLTSSREFSIDEKALSSLWLVLKERSIFMTKLRVYLKYQALLMRQLYLDYQEKLAQVELSLNRSLFESGQSTLIRQKTYQKTHAQLNLKRRKVELSLQRFRLKNPWLKPSGLLRDELNLNRVRPLKLTECLPAFRLEFLKSLLSESSIKAESEKLSLNELELLIQITLQEQETKLNDHQWLEFFELNYDSNFDSQGLIAELGINLPIGGVNHEVEKLKSRDVIKKLELLRFERQQAMNSGKLDIQSLQKLFNRLEPLPVIAIKELKDFDSVELAYLKLELWYLTWLERHELELFSLEYISLFPSFTVVGGVK